MKGDVTDDVEFETAYVTQHYTYNCAIQCNQWSNAEGYMDMFFMSSHFWLHQQYVSKC